MTTQRKPKRKRKLRFDLRDLAVELFRYKKYNDKTDADIAEYLSITEVSLSYKLRGIVPFHIEEIYLLKQLLGLSYKKAGRLFLTLLETDTSGA